MLLGLAAKMAEEPFRLLVSHDQHIQLTELLIMGLGVDLGKMIFQIVDSVIALFRVDFTGRGELAERQVSDATMNLIIIIINTFGTR